MQLVLSRLVSLVFVLAFLLFLGMTFDNVYMDIDPIRAQAMAAACARRDCSARHRLKGYDRTFAGQQFIYEWVDGQVVVNCARVHTVYGPRECVAQ